MRSCLAKSLMPIAASLVLFGTLGAQADVISAAPDTSFLTTPDTISFDGLASLTFSYLGSNPYDTTYTVDAVQTGGTAKVASSGFPGPGQQPIPFEDGSDILLNTQAFTAFPTPAGIAYSIADDYIGFSIGLADGTHYGYAEVAGPTLVSYSYNSVPGADIVTGTVPEPLTLSLFGAGLAGAAAIGRRRKSKKA